MSAKLIIKNRYGVTRYTKHKMAPFNLIYISYVLLFQTGGNMEL